MGQQTGIREVEAPSEIVLQKGQAFFGTLSAGTVLWVADGSVNLIQHLTLELAHLPMRKTLSRGAVYWLESNAWVEVQALKDSRLVVHAPEVVSVTQLLRQWLSASTHSLARLHNLVRVSRRSTTQ